MEPLLLVEDKPELRAMLKKALEKNGYAVEEAPDGSSAVEKVRSRRYQLVLSDLKLPGSSGLDVLRESRKAEATLPVILMTAYGSVEEAVTAMKEGAYDFIQKPIDLDHLKLLLERAAKQQELLRENLLLREEYSARYGFPRIVGKHPFVAVNCAAIPEGLVENELFGHERGAYTGAGARKIGKLELAHRGTLFLDEIGELPLAVQSKILRVLEERAFERVGGLQTIDVDVRVIAATNRDLLQCVAQKTFREDLYFRIAALPVTIPPLRERGQDVLLLASHFIRNFARELKKKEIRLSPEAEEVLLGYHWPGNVRELQNAIERAVILCEEGVILPADLNIRPAVAGAIPAPDFGGEPFDWEGPLEDVTQRAVTMVERAKIMAALREARWNKMKAAEKLGIAYKTLLAKSRALGI